MIVLMGMSNLGIMVLMVHVHDSKSRSISEVIDIAIMDLRGAVFFAVCVVAFCLFVCSLDLGCLLCVVCVLGWVCQA